MSAETRRSKLGGAISGLFSRLRRSEKRSRREWVAFAGTVFAVLGVVFGAAWLLTGAMTARSDGCMECHKRTVHSAAGSTEVHHETTCVDCHEADGMFARLVTNVPERIQHIAFGRSDHPRAASYGTMVFSAECKDCHADEIRDTVYDKTRGLKMSHKEPLDAGAECMDCHVLVKGKVAVQTTGMATCMRCHDGEDVRATCSLCHVGDSARSDLASSAMKSLATQILPTPPCETCHEGESVCKKCHKTGLPRIAPSSEESRSAE